MSMARSHILPITQKVLAPFTSHDPALEPEAGPECIHGRVDRKKVSMFFFVEEKRSVHRKERGRESELLPILLSLFSHQNIRFFLFIYMYLAI